MIISNSGAGVHVVPDSSILELLFYVSAGTLFLLSSCGGGYCFYKIIQLVFTTSSKIAKLMRSNDRHLVIALRRRLYAYVCGSTVASMMIGFSSVNYELSHLTGALVFLTNQVMLHFLEFVRTGVIELDDYELSHMSESLPMGEVSGMVEIEPLSTNEGTGEVRVNFKERN